jgi:hypothetical protein
MAKSKTVRVSEEELELLKALREGKHDATEKALEEVHVAQSEEVKAEANKELADAFVSAIERTRPPTKKTVANRKPNTPWTPKDGPKLKLKRKMYQHGIIIDKVNNEEIDLLNKIKPGRYCEGIVVVELRKDRGLNIDYPVKTNAQRLRLLNKTGVRNFTELVRRLADEAVNPTKYRRPEDSDLYE